MTLDVSGDENTTQYFFGVESKANMKHQTRDLKKTVTRHEDKKVWWVH